ncbi:MAG: UDP-2,3-diacylglucosamine diphosphatase LpxI [Planctomycetes bacterium]|jgi:hypothetical protein|nr:UDP-2,3-diacylglucosamine diphosphatase LpxI [Planctomycetota bacterium]
MGDEAQAPDRLGLIAGYGRFPILFAQNAKRNGVRLVGFGIRHEATPELESLVERLHWVGVAQVGRLIRLLKSEGIRRAVMAGKVRKTVMFAPFRILRLMPDLRTLRLWFRRVKDRRDDTLLGAVAGELASEGITLESSLLYCRDLLAGEGLLAGRGLTGEQGADVGFGWKLAKAMGGLDVGQSVAVKEKAVLAVEAIEGTDAAILRAGALGRAGFTVVKVSKPGQDVRFDVPAVGEDTIRTMAKAGAKVLAVEAGATLILGVEETLALAEKEGITVVGVRNPPEGMDVSIPSP